MTNKFRKGDKIIVYNANIRIYRPVGDFSSMLTESTSTEWGPYEAKVISVKHKWGCGQVAMLVKHVAGPEYVVYPEQCRKCK